LVLTLFCLRKLQRKHPHKLSDQVVKERPECFSGRPTIIQAVGVLATPLSACMYLFGSLSGGHRTPEEARIIRRRSRPSTPFCFFFRMVLRPCRGAPATIAPRRHEKPYFPGKNACQRVPAGLRPSARKAPPRPSPEGPGRLSRQNPADASAAQAGPGCGAPRRKAADRPLSPKNPVATRNN
jgi:hypothetical protein